MRLSWSARRDRPGLRGARAHLPHGTQGDAWTPQGLQRIAVWKRRIGAVPLVAIGGVTLERLPQVLAAGADVAAVVTDIVRAADPETRARQWLAAAA